MGSDETASGYRGALELRLVADPGPAYDIASKLAWELPYLLVQQVSDQIAWKVRAIRRRLPADEQGEIRLNALAGAERSEEDRDIVVCVTDQPRRAGLRPVVADASVARGVALASLPAPGAFRQYPRARETTLRLVDELTSERLKPDWYGEHQERGRPGGKIVAGLRRFKPADDEIDLRFVGEGARGATRLLAGMVHANRPW
jgi:hypothetical protein